MEQVCKVVKFKDVQALVYIARTHFGRAMDLVPRL